MFWNKTLTLYNKYEDENGAIKWYRHKLEHCFYKETKSKVNVGNVQIESNQSIARIPEQDKYLSPYDWAKLPEDKRSEYMTLQGGDLIFLGDVAEEIDEYTDGARASDLIAKYKALGSMSIGSVNINNFAPGAHYLVRGE
ncbi:MAG: hypothetical protein IJ370_03980 [Oscillospiraceae bacterium]|nr:hypothetical protein [Oscillospiraceae bacterium]MBQ8338556.1 hypothetical protein [Oscillospiraceae bacterium]